MVEAQAVEGVGLDMVEEGAGLGRDLAAKGETNDSRADALEEDLQGQLMAKTTDAQKMNGKRKNRGRPGLGLQRGRKKRQNLVEVR